jgi:hypothetical protein
MKSAPMKFGVNQCLILATVLVCAGGMLLPEIFGAMAILTLAIFGAASFSRCALALVRDRIGAAIGLAMIGGAQWICAVATIVPLFPDMMD